MTYLPTEVAGRWLYLYLILDAFSRKIVGFEVHDTDDSQHAAHLVKRTALAEGIHAMKAKPVLHGDNGATLKATTVLAMLQWLKIKPSYSRPRVSDDNAFVESLFRTADVPRFLGPVVSGKMALNPKGRADEEEPFQRRTDGRDPSGSRPDVGGCGRQEEQDQRADHLRLAPALRPARRRDHRAPDAGPRCGCRRRPDR
jgi:transposase InsO family protein